MLARVLKLWLKKRQWISETLNTTLSVLFLCNSHKQLQVLIYWHRVEGPEGNTPCKQIIWESKSEALTNFERAHKNEGNFTRLPTFSVSSDINSNVLNEIVWHAEIFLASLNIAKAPLLYGSELLSAEELRRSFLAHSFLQRNTPKSPPQVQEAATA